MITINNYFSHSGLVDFSTLPEALQKGHEFVKKATVEGKDWSSYHSSEPIKKTINIYLEKLNEFVAKSVKAHAKKKGNPSKSGKEKSDPSNKGHKSPGISETRMVERTVEELRFIRRFVNLNGKTKTKDEILRFINSLQKAILEKRIRKTSIYAEQITLIQSKLIDLHNKMKGQIKIELLPKTYEQLKELLGSEKVMKSVGFIKGYINLNGKTGIKKKADQLLKRITNAVDKKIIPHNDPYIDHLVSITRNLETFLNNPSEKTLSIEKNELNGLEGILGCACQQLNGLDQMPEVMNSMDFANMTFSTLGLKGKWRDLIGDPSTNFTAMVYGMPKMGKSYLCIEFAGYLARNHGKVLYVAKEEGLNHTLQRKLKDKSVAHPNLSVTATLPDQVHQYDFIFLDSVNKLGLNSEDLTRLKQLNPTKSFIFIFQSTKQGKFRGENTFQHDVDVIIEVPEKGKAIQMGRFNQGGEINIF